MREMLAILSTVLCDRSARRCGELHHPGHPLCSVRDLHRVSSAGSAILASMTYRQAMVSYRWTVLVAMIACGDNEPGRVILGPTIQLPLLISTDAARPYNHSCEVTVAAHEGHVVIASDQLHLASATSYMSDGGDIPRRVAIHVSTDAGESFSAAIRMRESGLSLN